jgi:hypothetical protein
MRAGRVPGVRSAAALMFALAGMLFTVDPSGAQAAPPPDLSGEAFLAAPSTADQGAVVTTHLSCDERGGTGSFAATGVASGPYPGTFTEQATVTVGAPDGNGFRPILSLDVSFTIDSEAGQVSGTKRFDPAVVPHSSDWILASCFEDTGAWFINFLQIMTPQLTYSALITTSEGKFLDHGTAEIFYFTYYVREGPDAGSTVDSFRQAFRSDGRLPVPAFPTDTAQCKDGGYRAFGFKNQGDCVSFVETGGKNEPGRNDPNR